MRTITLDQLPAYILALKPLIILVTPRNVDVIKERLYFLGYKPEDCDYLETSIKIIKHSAYQLCFAIEKGKRLFRTYWAFDITNINKKHKRSTCKFFVTYIETEIIKIKYE